MARNKNAVPGLPTISTNTSEANASQSAISPDLGGEQSPSSDETNVTDVNDNLPGIKNPGKTHNTTKVKKSKGDIQVVALLKGFYNQDRKMPDDQFTIKSFEEFGTWMRCVDSEDQAEAMKFLKEKKAKK